MLIRLEDNLWVRAENVESVSSGGLGSVVVRMRSGTAHYVMADDGKDTAGCAARIVGQIQRAQRWQRWRGAA